MSRLILRWETDDKEHWEKEQWQSGSGELYLIFNLLSIVIGKLLKAGRYDAKNSIDT